MKSAETIELPKAEYEALVQRNEDLEDLVAALDADRARARIPHGVALAVMDGASPLTAFRQHRGLTLRVLAQRASISPGYLSQIERGAKPGSAAVLARLARELETTIDALLSDGGSDLIE